MNMIILATSTENYCDNGLILNMAEEITCILFCALVHVNIVKKLERMKRICMFHDYGHSIFVS